MQEFGRIGAPAEIATVEGAHVQDVGSGSEALPCIYDVYDEPCQTTGSDQSFSFNDVPQSCPALSSSPCDAISLVEREHGSSTHARIGRGPRDEPLADGVQSAHEDHFSDMASDGELLLENTEFYGRQIDEQFGHRQEAEPGWDDDQRDYVSEYGNEDHVEATPVACYSASPNCRPDIDVSPPISIAALRATPTPREVFAKSVSMEEEGALLGPRFSSPRRQSQPKPAPTTPAAMRILEARLHDAHHGMQYCSAAHDRYAHEVAPTLSLSEDVASELGAPSSPSAARFHEVEFTPTFVSDADDAQSRMSPTAHGHGVPPRAASVSTISGGCQAAACCSGCMATAYGGSRAGAPPATSGLLDRGKRVGNAPVQTHTHRYRHAVTSTMLPRQHPTSRGGSTRSRTVTIPRPMSARLCTPLGVPPPARLPQRTAQRTASRSQPRRVPDSEVDVAC